MYQMIDDVLQYVYLCLALMGIVLIVLAACNAIIGTSRYVMKKGFDERVFHDARVMFGRGIIFGLEFMVAADVIRTVILPNYYEVGLLGLLVLIRTLLSYFLTKELHHT